jgi:hypothetical protein
MSDSQQLPPIAVIVNSTVADFDTWKAEFDAGQELRESASIVGHHINRSQDDPNALSVYMAATDADALKAFASSDELKAAMAKAGVVGPPTMSWATPVRESIDWDRTLPAFIIGHTVADFDSWLAGYDAAGEMRTASGIVGHAANRSLDNPSMAIVYHQAESFDTLHAFLGNPDLKAAMASAGVTSEPDISFYTGGWGRKY